MNADSKASFFSVPPPGAGEPAFLRSRGGTSGARLSSRAQVGPSNGASGASPPRTQARATLPGGPDTPPHAHALVPLQERAELRQGWLHLLGTVFKPPPHTLRLAASGLLPPSLNQTPRTIFSGSSFTLEITGVWGSPSGPGEGKGPESSLPPTPAHSAHPPSRERRGQGPGQGRPWKAPLPSRLPQPSLTHFLSAPQRGRLTPGVARRGCARSGERAGSHRAAPQS